LSYFVKQIKKYLVSLRTSRVSRRASGPLAGGAEVESYQVLDQLTLLVDKSLLICGKLDGQRHSALPVQSIIDQPRIAGQ